MDASLCALASTHVMPHLLILQTTDFTWMTGIRVKADRTTRQGIAQWLGILAW